MKLNLLSFAIVAVLLAGTGCRDATRPDEPTKHSEEEFVAGDHRPVISPDGSQVVFMSNRHDRDWELFSIGLDGTGLRRLTQNPGWDGYAVFSPDGGSFFFDRQSGDSKSAHRFDLQTGQVKQVLAIEGAFWPGEVTWKESGVVLRLSRAILGWSHFPASR